MLDTLEFYRVEMLLNEYEEYLKEEQKQHDEQKKGYEQQSQYTQPNSGDLYRNVPKFDGFNSSSMPKVSMPNMSIPSFK